MRIGSVILAALLATPLFVVAKDLGVQGDVYPIVERDLRQRIMQDLSKMDMQKYKKDMMEMPERFEKSMPIRDLPRVAKTSTRWLDMSITIPDDIQGPIKGPDGEWVTAVIVPKGTRVNPLGNGANPQEVVLFFDGQDEAQVKFVEDVLKARPWDVLPVNTSGSPKPASVRFERPVFFASDEQLKRFDIKATPSAMYAGEGKRDGLMGVTELAPPYTVKALNKIRVPKL